ncbi:2-phosphosulfolactate phosphatase [Bacillus spizizenii]|uniref:Probable 2-phosphosulfolactate phosphatase n=1 Tax=Bacillus spizizenii (strain DSM 15029 / JCM 12233 / NBRC 101239 / NRRL B-23049 / TU-B-10) TaxID=1052585 RepID=G4NUX7_BACS4|nr:2-phosphosulfolactate phosphatase [Bacillus spizizenii]AEP86055.1 sporulation putative 2-phosphosulfolactate phosphatase YitC [Bacillus spizizenii TU-B-10]MEC1584715.1 2-phosphosulfolactate phosphatase [Bacillus spizizenii]GEK25600.1 putative 2-phosphosulfolactate phosphatase [Bacillus spizizenii]
MPITIYQGHHHSLAPADINIVIDVIRAFTVAHYAFIGGAKEILLVGTAEEAFALKDTYPDYVLTGEEKGVGISGFDLDNSPKRMAMQDMADKRLIQKTTNGVTAALGALNAKHLFVTGFSNAKTTAEYVKTLAVKDCVLNIVASHPSGDDDMACAEYIKGIIEGTNAVTAAGVIERIKRSSVAEKFFDRSQPLFDPEDISYCTKELTGDFVMKVKQEREVPTIERVII